MQELSDVYQRTAVELQEARAALQVVDLNAQVHDKVRDLLGKVGGAAGKELEDVSTCLFSYPLHISHSSLVW